MNLLRLCHDLSTDNYRHAAYDHKIVNEKKRRDIYVASVRDRVVHRLLYDYLVEIMDKRLDYDVWSCREGKGLHGALQRTQTLLQKHPSAWIWRADIKKFFDSVPHAQMLEVVAKHVNDERAKKLLDTVIRSYNYLIGLPIGNLTSQILANMYLNEFDQYVRQQLKPLAYVRYGDDFILFYARQCDIKSARHAAIQRLTQLGLTINPAQDYAMRAWQGLHFLGHTITASDLKVSRKVDKMIIRKVNLQNVSSYSSLNLSDTTRSMLPWLPDV